MRDAHRRIPPALLFCCGVVLLGAPAPAVELDLWDHPLAIQGYVSQSAAFGIAGEHFDTQKGFQAAIFQGLVEVTYDPRPDLRLFVSGKLDADWAYPILEDNTSWQRKGFDDSRSRLFVFDDLHDLLNEANVTWRPGPFYIRVGKQIVR
jgi:hypothetical protein